MRHFPLRFAFGVLLLAVLGVWLAWHLHTRDELPVAGDSRSEPASALGEEREGARSAELAGRTTRCDVVVVVKASDGTPLVEPYVHLATVPVQKAERLGADRFVFRQLRPGAWDLEVRSRGLRGLDPQLVVPSPPPPTLELSVVLSPYGRVGGRVLRPDGRAAAGAKVNAHHDGGEGLRGVHGLDVGPSYKSSHGMPVEVDGSFRLEFLPADVRVRVAATHPKFGAALAELTPRAGENDPLTLTLGPSTNVRGRIPRLPRGAHPEVFLFGVVKGHSSEQQGGVTCDDDGAFLFEPVPPGDKAITAFLRQEGQVTMWHARTSVAEGQSRDVGDLELGTGPDLVFRITAAPPVPEGVVEARVTGLLYLPKHDGAEQETLFLQFQAALDRTVRVVGLLPGSLSLGASLGPTHRLGHVQVRAGDRSATLIDVLIPLRPPPVPQREVVSTAVPPPGIPPKEFVGVAHVLRDGRPLIGSYMHQFPGRLEWKLPVPLDDTRANIVSYWLGHGFMSGPVPVQVDEKGNGRTHHETWQPAAQLAFRVRGVDGVPLKRVDLTIYKSTAEDVAEQQPVARVTSDAQGHAVCTLWPGEAYVIRTFVADHVERVLRIAPESLVAGKTLQQDVDLAPRPADR